MQAVHGSHFDKLNAPPSDWHKKSVSTDLHELREEFIPPEILAAKRVNFAADTSQWEEEIEQLALRGQLYGLSKEEIDIVEGKGSQL